MPKLGRKREVDRNVYDLARERLETAFGLFDTISVMFSGGKDSTACLNMTLDVAKSLGREDKVIVHHYDEEAIPYETEAYVRRVMQSLKSEFHWWCVPVKHRNGCSRVEPWWYPWAEEAKDKWVRPLPPEGKRDMPGYPSEVHKRLTIPEMNGLIYDPAKLGRVGIVMGIRSDESLTRMRAVLMGRSREHDFIIKFDAGTAAGNISKVYPIYDWTTSDVWTAPHKFGWDYNTAYDVMDLAGILPNDQRCAPPYGEEPMRGLYQFKECFPNIWDKMSKRVAGAESAARYATTELYGYMGLPEKPADMSWKDFVKHFIDQHPEPYRTQISKRISREIKRHYQHTKEPILPLSPHPITGLRWVFLAQLAMRGDFKNRRFSTADSDIKIRRKRRQAYDKERKALSAH